MNVWTSLEVIGAVLVIIGGIGAVAMLYLLIAEHLRLRK